MWKCCWCVEGVVPTPQIPLIPSGSTWRHHVWGWLQSCSSHHWTENSSLSWVCCPNRCACCRRCMWTSQNCVILTWINFPYVAVATRHDSYLCKQGTTSIMHHHKQPTAILLGPKSVPKVQNRSVSALTTGRHSCIHHGTSFWFHPTKGHPYEHRWQC